MVWSRILSIITVQTQQNYRAHYGTTMFHDLACCIPAVTASVRATLQQGGAHPVVVVEDVEDADLAEAYRVVEAMSYRVVEVMRQVDHEEAQMVAAIRASFETLFLEQFRS